MRAASANYDTKHPGAASAIDFQIKACHATYCVFALGFESADVKWAECLSDLGHIGTKGSEE